jgi:transcriptional regulator with XRE-family HTH domain
MQDRIKKIIQNNNLTSAQFADKIGVTRSSLSHVLSGRNKASLEYVLKIIKAFPHIDSNWLLTGDGNYDNKEVSIEGDSSENDDVSMHKIQNSFTNVNKKMAKGKQKIIKDVLPSNEKLVDDIELKNNDNQMINNLSISNNDIDKIVIFYKNGKFKAYSGF